MFGMECSTECKGYLVIGNWFQTTSIETGLKERERKAITKQHKTTSIFSRNEPHNKLLVPKARGHMVLTRQSHSRNHDTQNTLDERSRSGLIFQRNRRMDGEVRDSLDRLCGILGKKEWDVGIEHGILERKSGDVVGCGGEKRVLLV